MGEDARARDDKWFAMKCRNGRQARSAITHTYLYSVRRDSAGLPVNRIYRHTHGLHVWSFTIPIPHANIGITKWTLSYYYLVGVRREAAKGDAAWFIANQTSLGGEGRHLIGHPSHHKPHDRKTLDAILEIGTGNGLTRLSVPTGKGLYPNPASASTPPKTPLSISAFFFFNVQIRDAFISAAWGLAVNPVDNTTT